MKTRHAIYIALVLGGAVILPQSFALMRGRAAGSFGHAKDKAHLSRTMPDRARFFLWRQNGKAIAFSIALVHDETIYDDYLGLDYQVALDLHLYFYTFRDIIRSTSHASPPAGRQPQ